jgi:hypothetical protein
MARVMTRVGKGESDKGKDGSGGLGDDEGKDGSQKVESNDDKWGDNGGGSMGPKGKH